MDSNTTHVKEFATFELSTPECARCAGAWTSQGIARLQHQLASLTPPTANTLTLIGESITHMDTTGAWLLQKLVKRLQQMGINIEYEGFHSEHESLLSLLRQRVLDEPPTPPSRLTLLPFVGVKTENGLRELMAFMAFIGETFIESLAWLRNPGRIRWVAFLRGIQFTGSEAAFIVALLSILIGIVLAYQLGVQLRNYGADIFVVDLLGIALLREFAPLVTAIILAGRTGSSYTAQIGTMKLNEEIDALRTFGLSPIQFLVLPRLFALLVALPLLVVLADVFSVAGGMIMANGMLDIPYTDFLSRFSKVVPLKNYVIGLIKTPVFAVLIATIGCFQGFQVSGGAESVGRHTTTSVVQAIFMIIVADAGFSVVFSALGL